MDKETEILKELNDQQKAAAVNYKGPTLIVAGAGSGKTRTLTQRIAYMLSDGVLPEQILALTFTKKAAGEMKTRIMEAVGRECHPWKITMGTFHAVFIRLLSEFADRIGFSQKFSIYDENDSVTILKQIVKRLGLDDSKYKPSILKSRISLAKNSLLTPEKYGQLANLTEEDKKLHIPQFLSVFREYCIEVRKNGAMDFDDILLNTYTLLKDNKDIRETLGERFRYILVDEYQDTNIAQYRILGFLTEVHHNICVVGDDSQSIYSFRGAKVENILKFRNDYPESRTFLLEHNYRSTENIVNAANSLIKHNTKKIEKKVFSSSGEGELIRVFQCFSDRNEVSTVVRDIKKRLLDFPEFSESDFAVLYRNNSLSRLMEDELRTNNIPYMIYGGHSFYKRKEILDMVAYMKFCLNERDDVSLLRVINVPARGIGETSIARIRECASKKGMSIWQTIESTPEEELGIRGKAANGVKAFRNLIKELLTDQSIASASQFVAELIDRSHIADTLRQSGDNEDAERAENIESLKAAVLEWEMEMTANPEFEQLMNMSATEQLQNWLTDIALLSDTDTKDNGKPHVTLMTVHASKGLEFGNVYIIGVEEDIFPSVRAISLDDLEEERRIFYVAITRAKQYVALSWSSERFKFGMYESCRQSRFIDEIDQKYIFGAAKRKRLPWEDEMSRLQWQQPSESRQATRPQSPARPKPSATAVKTTYRKEDLQEIDESNGIRKGTRIEHRIFGKGTVKKLELRGADVRLTISFDVVGEKVIIERFGSLKIL